MFAVVKASVKCSLGKDRLINPDNGSLISFFNCFKDFYGKIIGVIGFYVVKIFDNGWEFLCSCWGNERYIRVRVVCDFFFYLFCY